MTQPKTTHKGDALGDRMKLFENAECGRKCMPLLPILARVDGRHFSAFTKYFAKPYDKRMTDLMIAVTRKLINETNALLGYTQSDEISLCFYTNIYKQQLFFDGRIHKMCSTLAALTTIHFFDMLPDYFGFDEGYTLRGGYPTFDARVWQVPTLEEAANCFLWREIDATRNAIESAARSMYSHNECMHKNCDELQEMMFQKGTNFNDYPVFFKRGTYIRRTMVKRKLEECEINNLPPLHNARKNPEMEFERSVIDKIDLPPLSKVLNRVNVLFFGAEPRQDE